MDDVAFGRYQLLELIGEGGMGKVYKAHDTVMGRDVAIKVLPRELATNPGYEQRFRREASVAARLTEPHIIPIFEAGEIDGQLYLVMPVIAGVDVHTVLHRDGSMSPQRAVQVIEQLAAALNAAHQHGLVHRDIKPSNALLTGDDFVYLIDFGIAHDVAATRLTSTGMTVGTMAYMAPERFTAGTADARADVYSLTCVLYECLTGAAPYSGNSIEQQIAGHLSVDPPKPSEHRSEVGVGFDEVIAVGMAKNPDERYQSARELAGAARAALGAAAAPVGDPHSGPTLLADRSPLAGVDDWVSSAPARGPEPLRQQHAHFNFAAAQQQRPHPVEAAAPPPWPPAGPPSWQPAPRSDRTRWLVLGLVAALVVVVALVGVGIYFGTNKSKPVATNTSSTASSAIISTSGTAPPVGEAVLDGLLLTVDQINTTMGATDMTITSGDRVWWDDSDNVSPKECLPLVAPLEKDIYAGSGQTAARNQNLDEPGKFDLIRHVAGQGVVLFPSAQEASAFVSASMQKWKACTNRSFTLAVDNSGTHPWAVGELIDINGPLSITRTQEDTTGLAKGWVCQRALTSRNNVVIDTAACGHLFKDNAVSIAGQIAAKVPTT